MDFTNNAPVRFCCVSVSVEGTRSGQLACLAGHNRVIFTRPTFLRMWNCKCSIYIFLSFSSIALPAHSGPRPLIQFRSHFSLTVRLLSRVTSSSQGRYLNTRTTQTQNKRIHTPNIPALSGIRTHDPSVWDSEDSSCLRQRGYCDRRLPFVHRGNSANLICEARGSVIGWGTMLRAGRLRFRFPMRSLFSWPNPSSRTMALGSTQPLTEMSTRNLTMSTGRPTRKADW
jgi:hypothetical protein